MDELFPVLTSFLLAASVSGLSIKFTSSSKYFRAVYTGTSNFFGDDQPAMNANEINSNVMGKPMNFQNGLTSSISIKENDELTVNCTVSSSKPAANISIWIVPNHRTTIDEETRKLDITVFQTYRNKDSTLRSVAIAKFIVNRLDNHKSITCIAENTALDEKWESKRVVNVLCKLSSHSVLKFEDFVSISFSIYRFAQVQQVPKTNLPHRHQPNS